MSSDYMLTPDAHAKLKSELEKLKGKERQRIAEAIREAKAHGDLRENAAYHEAKLNQSRLESRIADLEKSLQLAKIIEHDHEAEHARLGVKVVLEDLEFGDTLEIRLVSSYEADPANDLISISSPLGAALVGKERGDEVDVETPGGAQRYRITHVE